MKIAIYTRKSKYSDKSESIESQIEYCKNAARTRYPEVEEFKVYIDEGFSGGNTERPQYKQLLSDIRTKKEFQALICYKIDRISRSLVDFANLQQYLEKYNVNIISASEGFDTSSAWGSAVLNILMIFAQLERNNISERIRDTMLHYAKQGRWTGGLTPTGFESRSIPYIDALGSEKNMVVLSPIPDEIEIVKLIYSKYLELRSLSALETYLSQKGIRTKKNKSYCMSTIRNILANPVYAAADSNLYHYFKSHDVDLCNDETEYDGMYSVMPYNREDRKKLTDKPMSEWIIAISKHSGIIPGDLWVQVQHILYENKDKMPRSGTARHGIFAGLIKCSKCGSTMRVKNGRVSAKGGYREFYYVCNLKETSKRACCDVININGNKLEADVLDLLIKISSDEDCFSELLERNKISQTEHHDDRRVHLDKLKRELSLKQSGQQNVMLQLAQSSDPDIGKPLLAMIKNFSIEIREIEIKISTLETALVDERSKELDKLSLHDAFAKIGSMSNVYDITEQRCIIKRIIHHMEWNGQDITIFFRSGGSITGDQHLQTYDTRC